VKSFTNLAVVGILFVCSFLVFIVKKGVLSFEKRPETKRLPDLVQDFDLKLKNGVKRVDQLMKVLDVIPIDISSENPYINCSDRVVFNHSFYFIDNSRKSIFKYHINGQFAGTVSSRGPGPGQFDVAGHLRKIFNNQLGLFDLTNGRIHIFNEHGDYLSSTPSVQFFLGRWGLKGPSFIWDDPESLYISVVRMADQNDTSWHAKFAPVFNDLGEVVDLELVTTFGKKPIEHEDKYGPSGISAFIKIKDRIWVGSPYFSKVYIYDLDGNLLREFFLDVDEPLVPESYEGVTIQERKKLFELANWNGAIHQIELFNDFVLVRAGIRGYVFFDQKGNQLTSQRIVFSYGAFSGQPNEPINFTTNYDALINEIPNALKIPMPQDITEPEDDEQLYLILAEPNPATFSLKEVAANN
jgi:hypothetical protein